VIIDVSLFSATDEMAQDVDFFHDFIEYLTYLENQPIKRTATGRISLKDIDNLRQRFKIQDIFREFKEFGWKINTEDVVQFLTQIKIIAEVMCLTYKRKDKILLSRNGKAYLKNLSPLHQYKQMVFCFWNKVNWSYFSPGREIDGLSVIDILQENQEIIWQALLRKGNSWIDFPVFCQTLYDYFHLEPYYEGLENKEFHLRLDVEYGLVHRNLEIFGCVEVKEEKRDTLEKIVAIKPTPLGLHMFFEALTAPF